MTQIDLHTLTPRRNPFTVPEGYFAEFPARLMQRIHDLPQREEAATMPFVRWIPYIGAASVAAMLLLFMHLAQPATISAPDVSSGIATTSTGTSSVDEAYDYIMQTNGSLYNAYDNDTNN